MQKQLLIIGAGLSGLLAAYRLKKRGFSVKIIEARDRVGGRIYTKISENNTPVEMGATWFWDENTSVKALLEELGIEHFVQNMQGEAVFEAFSAAPPQLVQIPTQPQSYRISGGTMALLKKLAEAFSVDELLLNQTVESIDFTNQKVEIRTNAIQFEADAVIVTIPPALFAESVAIVPIINPEITEVWKGTHTWMKDSIKVAVVYDNPFWKAKNMSGTVFSNVGPITEFYEHSNAENTRFALCGFMNGGLAQFSATEREQKVRTQLSKLFGAEGLSYTAYEETLWMHERQTVLPTNGYLQPHQNNGHPVFQQSLYDGRLFISGTETSPQFGGYMEGAIRAAERTIEMI